MKQKNSIYQHRQNFHLEGEGEGEGEDDMMITQFRNRTEVREFLGISSNSGITTSNMIVSSLTHLVTTQFPSGIPELSETGIGRNS